MKPFPGVGCPRTSIQGNAIARPYVEPPSLKSCSGGSSAGFPSFCVFLLFTQNKAGGPPPLDTPLSCICPGKLNYKNKARAIRGITPIVTWHLIDQELKEERPVTEIIDLHDDVI